MVLSNLTQKSLITEDLKEATSIVDKSLGLLKKSNPRSLLFKTRFGIHTLFLKEPIDVLILDKAGIVKKIATVNPNRIFIYHPIYSTVVELPKGTIKKSKTKVGDKLKLQKF